MSRRTSLALLAVSWCQAWWNEPFRAARRAGASEFEVLDLIERGASRLTIGDYLAARELGIDAIDAAALMDAGADLDAVNSAIRVGIEPNDVVCVALTPMLNLSVAWLAA